MTATTSRRLVTLVGLVLSAVFVYLAVQHLKWEEITDAWRTARPFPWVLLAAAFYLVGHLVRGQRCRLLVQRESVLSLWTASNIVVVGYASNNILPARLGEFVRAGMLVERTGIPLVRALTVTFVERLFDGITILVLLIASTFTVAVGYQIESIARWGGLIFGVATAGLLAAIFLPNLLLSIASRLSARLGPKWHERVLRIVTSVISGGACLKKPRDATMIVVLSLVIWTLESLMFAFILPAFGLELNVWWGIVAMSVTNLGILIPSTPGFVGVFDTFCKIALVALGVSGGKAISYAVLVHLTFYVPVTLWGAGAVLWYGVQVGATAAVARAARMASPATEQLHGVAVHVIASVEPEAKLGAVPEFYLALAEALVPSIENSAKRTAILADVAEFTYGQIAALPSRLRWMFNAGMSTFRLFVRVRYFRSFCGLAAEKRRDAVNAWAFGRVNLFRQLFRPVRSTALLAYYEHAWVTEAIDAKAPRASRQLRVVAHG